MTSPSDWPGSAPGMPGEDVAKLLENLYHQNDSKIKTSCATIRIYKIITNDRILMFHSQESKKPNRVFPPVWLFAFLVANFQLVI